MSRLIIIMLCTVGLSLIGQRRHLLRAGFVPDELYEMKDGNIHFNGEECELGMVRHEAITALCAFPKILIVMSALIIAAVFVAERLIFPAGTITWFDHFLQETFPHAGHGFQDLLMDTPDTFARFYSLASGNLLSTAVLAAMLLACTGLVMIIPLRRKSVGMAAYNICVFGRNISAKKLKIRRLAFIGGAFIACLAIMWAIGIVGTWTICIRSAFR